MPIINSLIIRSRAIQRTSKIGLFFSSILFLVSLISVVTTSINPELINKVIIPLCFIMGSLGLITSFIVFLNLKYLQTKKDVAESIAKSKTEFLSHMSHEIRTPINAILGITEILLETEINSEQQEYITLIDNSSRNLLRIINDILDYSRIEAGKMTTEITAYDFKTTLTDMIKALTTTATKRDIKLNLYIDPSIPNIIYGDSNKLAQIIYNLVGNALKFTRKGGKIDVTSKKVALGNSGTLLQISVADNGIGIPPHKQQLIFTEFEQGDASTVKNYGGTGLGLSISTRLIELMGGSISLESAPDVGSTFTINLPIIESLEIINKNSINKVGNIEMLTYNSSNIDQLPH